MSNKIIGDNGEVQEIPLIKRGLYLFLWYLIGRWGGYVLIFMVLAFIGGLVS
jgi:hypothetical protein